MAGWRPHETHSWRPPWRSCVRVCPLRSLPVCTTLAAAAPTLPSDTAGPQYGLYAPSEASRPPPAPPTYRPPNPGFEGDFNLLPAAPPVRYGAFDQLKTTAVEPPLMAVARFSGRQRRLHPMMGSPGLACFFLCQNVFTVA